MGHLPLLALKVGGDRAVLCDGSDDCPPNLFRILRFVRILDNILTQHFFACFLKLLVDLACFLSRKRRTSRLRPLQDFAAHLNSWYRRFCFCPMITSISRRHTAGTHDVYSPNSASASLGSWTAIPSHSCCASSSSSVCTVTRCFFLFGCSSTSSSSELDSSEEDPMTMGSSSVLACDFLFARLVAWAFVAAHCLVPAFGMAVLRRCLMEKLTRRTCLSWVFL